MMHTGQFVFECTVRGAFNGHPKKDQLRLIKSMGGMRWGIPNDVWSIKAASSADVVRIERALTGCVSFVKKPIVLTQG